jgi:hypothetical protein
MPLRPNVYSFNCPKCKKLCLTTHLRWTIIDCLHCSNKIKNEEIELIK